MMIDLLTESIAKCGEVLVTNTPFVKIGNDTINELYSLSKKNKRKRIRLCTHGSVETPVHEMFIVLQRGNYIRPHKHLDKAESLLLLKGKLDFITFNVDGSVMERTEMGDFSSGAVFYHKMEKAVYHSLLIKSKYVAFLEVTNGPFQPKETVFAPWAPPEAKIEEGKLFLKNLSEKLG